MSTGSRRLVAWSAAATVAHVLPGVAAWRSMRCRLAPALSGVGTAGHVALTFDDGPDPDSTPAVLDALDALGWKATFFVLGYQIRRDPGLVGEVAARGHEIGVHGDRHVSHMRRDASWVVRDVRRCLDLVEDHTGSTPTWFRPPYGALATPSLLAARLTHLRPVLWTTWGRDWRAQATPQTIVADIERTWHPGATVLLHDSDVTSAPGSWRAAVAALPLLADRWADQTVGPLREHGIGGAAALKPPAARA